MGILWSKMALEADLRASAEGSSLSVKPSGIVFFLTGSVSGPNVSHTLLVGTISRACEQPASGGAPSIAVISIEISISILRRALRVRQLLCMGNAQDVSFNSDNIHEQGRDITHGRDILPQQDRTGLLTPSGFLPHLRLLSVVFRGSFQLLNMGFTTDLYPGDDHQSQHETRIGSRLLTLRKTSRDCSYSLSPYPFP